MTAIDQTAAGSLTADDRRALHFRTRQVAANAPGADTALLTLVEELVARIVAEQTAEAREVARLEAIAAVEAVPSSAQSVRMAS